MGTLMGVIWGCRVICAVSRDDPHAIEREGWGYACGTDGCTDRPTGAAEP